MNAAVRGLVVVAALLSAGVSAASAAATGGAKDVALSRLSLAERATAASTFFRLAKTPDDKLLALRLLVEAADLGAPDAAAELGLIFLKDTSEIPARPELARKYFDAAINAGSVEATYQLGRALLRGDGLAKDTATGIRLLTRKRIANSPMAARAAYDLGQVYLSGDEGLKPNPVKARQYLEQAIGGGLEDAKLKLGRALATGEGLPADPQAGIALLEDIRRAGGDRAAAELGELYLTGASTIGPDPILARQLLQEAADAGDQGAALRLGRVLIDGKLLQGDPQAGIAILSRLTAADSRAAARAGRELGVFFLASAKSDSASAHKARFYLEGAADKGDETAKFYLGKSLLTGDGLPLDIGRGEELLREVAANSGQYASRAHYALALHQLSIPSRAPEAKEHLEISATAGFGPARLRLGEELLSGRALAGDPKTAIKLLERLSAENGTVAESANQLLGNFFLRGGAGTKPNPTKARLYLEKAATAKPGIFVRLGRAELAGDLGRPDGQRALAYFEKAQVAGVGDAFVYTARIYLTGKPGVKRNVAKGIKLLEEAAAAGNAFAARQIIAVYRGDGVKNHKPDLDKARSHLEAFRNVGAEDEVLMEAALLSIAAEPGDLETDSAAFNRIPAPRQANAIRRVLLIKPRAAVYVVQERLKSAGLYGAGVDGIAGRRTLEAIASACRQGQPDACTKPLSGTTLGFIVTSYPLASAVPN